MQRAQQKNSPSISSKSGKISPESPEQVHLNLFSSCSLFLKPRYSTSSNALIHLPYLFWLLEAHSPRRIVQLGVGDGAAYLGMCQAADELSLETTMCGISSSDTAHGVALNAISSHDKYYSDFSVIRNEKLATAHRHFRAAGIDLLICNTPIDTENAALLSSKWMGLLSNRAIVVIIDSEERIKDEGAREWLDPLLSEHDSIELRQGNGLISLFVGDEHADPIKRLAKLGSDTPGFEQASRVFGTLGERLVEKQLAFELKGTLEAKEALLEQVSNEKTSKSEEVAAAIRSEETALQRLAVEQAKNFDYERARPQLEKKIAEAEKELAKAEQDIVRLEKRASEKLARSDDERNATQTKLDDLSVQYRVLRERYHARLEDIAELGHKIARTDKEKEQLKSHQQDRQARDHILEKLSTPYHALQKALRRKGIFALSNRAERRLADDMSLVATSGFFDADWYLSVNSDVAESGADPVRHYVAHGAYELRDPGPRFSAFKYHKANTDVTGEGIPALLHYLRSGRAEDRRIYNVGESD